MGKKLDITTETGFELSNGVKFTIYHNLPDMPGLRIQDAFQNWLVRTKHYNARSFVEYIRGKDTGFIVMTEKEFNEKYERITDDKE